MSEIVDHREEYEVNDRPSLLRKAISIGTCALLFSGFSVPGLADPANSPDMLEDEKPSNIALIYSGKDRTWSSDDFAPYLVYMNEDQPAANETVNETMFDTFLFLAIYSDSGHLFQGYNIHTNASDWNWYVEKLFAKNQQLGALDKAAEELGKEVNVIIMIPYPHKETLNFGDIDNDGTSEDFSSVIGRFIAVRHYIDSVLDAWDDKNYQNLNLVGFYWNEECIWDDFYINFLRGLGFDFLLDRFHVSDDEMLIKTTGQYLDEKGLQFFWIPTTEKKVLTNIKRQMEKTSKDIFIQTIKDLIRHPVKWLKRSTADSSHAADGKDFGFDHVMLQPNYYQARWERGLKDLEKISDLAKKEGLGIEIEFDELILRDQGHRKRANDYLDIVSKADYDGPIAYYMGYKTLNELAAKNDPLYHKLYLLIANKN